MNIQDIMRVCISPVEIIDNKTCVSIYTGYVDDIPEYLLDSLVISMSTDKTNIVLYVD